MNNNRLRNEMLLKDLIWTIKLPVQGKIHQHFYTSWKSIFWYLLTPVCGRFDYLIDRIVQKTEFRVKYRAGAGQLYHRTRFKIKKRLK